MKKIYSFAFVLVLTFNAFAQSWDFTNTADGWLTKNYSNFNTLQPTYAVFTIVDDPNDSVVGYGNTGSQFYRTDAAMNSANQYIVITLRNNTKNVRLQVALNTNSAATSYFINQTIKANSESSNFETYYVDMSGADGWTGTVNDVSIRFKELSSGQTVLAGTVDIDKIVLSNTLSTEDKSIMAPKVSLYPNPTTNWLHVNASIKVDRFEIYDVLGKKQNVSTMINSNKINTQNLSSGIYLLKLYHSNNAITIKKFLKN